MTGAAVEGLVRAVDEELALVEAAHRLRQEFHAAVSASSDLQWVPETAVPPEHMVGLGAVRFVPAFFVPPSHVDALNALLAHQLRQQSSLFVGAMTNGADKGVCIVVQTGPAILRKDCVSWVVNTIAETAAKLDLPPEVQEGLSRVVLKGIREAEQRLQSSQSEAYNADNIVRSLPLVGRVWSWFSAPAQQPSSLGHTFDIRSQELSKVGCVQNV